jgi:hypothetical protein
MCFVLQAASLNKPQLTEPETPDALLKLGVGGDAICLVPERLCLKSHFLAQTLVLNRDKRRDEYNVISFSYALVVPLSFSAELESLNSSELDRLPSSDEPLC